MPKQHQACCSRACIAWRTRTQSNQVWWAIDQRATCSKEAGRVTLLWNGHLAINPPHWSTLPVASSHSQSSSATTNTSLATSIASALKTKSPFTARKGEAPGVLQNLKGSQSQIQTSGNRYLPVLALTCTSSPANKGKDTDFCSGELVSKKIQVFL